MSHYYTIEELIDRLKYHGHCYDLNRLEMLQGLKEQWEYEREEMEAAQVEQTNNEVIENLEVFRDDILELIESIFESKLEEINSDSEDMVKSFPDNLAIILTQADIKRQVLTMTVNEIKRKITDKII